QWFASVDKIRDQILGAINEVQFFPDWGQKRLYNMIRDRGDWVISRQRVWGVPLPIFYGEDGEAIMTKETIEHVAKLVEEHGSNIWFQREAKDLLPEGFTSEHSPNGKFTKETDIMDVWFDSGSSHEAVLMGREDHKRPADVYLEGSDQYRGWFNSSISTAVAVTGKAPFEAIVSHGFTLDGNGRKMSKSLGNVMDPLKIQKQLGIDILRLWVSSVDYQADVRISQGFLKQISEAYRKIRNTVRFMLGNLADFDPANDTVPAADVEEADSSMLNRLQKLLKNVRDSYDIYEYSPIYSQIHNFCAVDLSSFYLDYAKDILYIEAADSHRRRSIQTAYYEIVTTLVKLLTPIIPHTTDEMWEYIPGVREESVQLTDIPEPREITGFDTLYEKWDHFMNVRDDVLKALEEAREEKVIGKSLEAKLTVVPKDDQTAEVLNGISNVHQLFIVSEADITNEASDANEYRYVDVLVEKHPGETCARCWTVSETVGDDKAHPDLCSRCADIVKVHYSA